MTDEIRPPCFGKSAMFDSTSADLHEEAKAICATCPLIDWCEREYQDAKAAAAFDGEPEGTWAGKLRGGRYDPAEPCSRGHERTPTNTYRDRRCRMCALDRSAAQVARKRAARLAAAGGEVA